MIFGPSLGKLVASPFSDQRASRLGPSHCGQSCARVAWGRKVAKRATAVAKGSNEDRIWVPPDESAAFGRWTRTGPASQCRTAGVRGQPRSGASGYCEGPRVRVAFARHLSYNWWIDSGTPRTPL